MLCTAGSNEFRMQLSGDIRGLVCDMLKADRQRCCRLKKKKQHISRHLQEAPVRNIPSISNQNSTSL